MGHEIWPNDAPYGGNAWIMGNATGLPQDHNYNLILGTMPAEQGTNTGRVLLMGGNAISDVDAGSVYIQGGTGQDGAGGVAGDIFLVPGESAASSAGQVILVDQSTGTGATLTAAAAFTGGMLAGSSVTFGTSAGAVVVTFAGGENLVATRALFDATGVVTAAGDPIVLTTVAKGPTAEVYFLMESGAGTDGLLGTFSGETMTAGTWPSQIGIVASDANEISFGPTGAVGPMIYNADTGKLTVPGIIDPTGMIFDEAAPPPIAGNEGAIFVSDGTSGLDQNHLYYEFDSGTTLKLSGGGTGDISGSGATTDDALARWDGTTGLIIQNSTATLTDAGHLSVPTLQVTTGTGTAGNVLTDDGLGNASWVAPTGAAGDVVGPVSSVDDAVARFDSTSGKLLQNSTATLTDAGVLTATDVTATAGLVGATLQVTTGAVLNHVLTSDVSGNATWVAPAGGAADQVVSDFIFQPGGGAPYPSKNVYTDFLLLYADLSTSTAPKKRLILDDSVTSPIPFPAGTFDLAGVTLTNGKVSDDTDNARTHIHNGTTGWNAATVFQNVARIEGLQALVPVAGAGTPFTFTTDSVVYMENCWWAQISATGDPFFSVSGGSTVTFRCLDSTVGTNTGAVVSGSGTDTISFTLRGTSSIGPASLKSAGGDTVSGVDLSPGSSFDATQPHWSGGAIPAITSPAGNVDFNPTGMTVAVGTDVQTAIDQLDAAIGSGTRSAAFAFVGAGITTTTTITGLNVGDIVVQVWIRYTTTFLDATSTVECLESGGGSPIVSTAMTLPTSNQPGAWVFDPVYVAAGGPHDLQVKVISGAGETQGEGVVIALIHRA
jgi:hypothetical protein